MNRRLSRTQHQSLWRIFAIPAALSALSLAGLILALTGDGWRDILGAILLLLPIPVFIRAWLQRS